MGLDLGIPGLLIYGWLLVCAFQILIDILRHAGAEPFAAEPWVETAHHHHRRRGSASRNASGFTLDPGRWSVGRVGGYARAWHDRRRAVGHPYGNHSLATAGVDRTALLAPRENK